MRRLLLALVMVTTLSGCTDQQVKEWKEWICYVELWHTFCFDPPVERGEVVHPA